MPNILQELLAQDAAQIISQIGHRAEWKGSTYDCLIADPDVDVDLQEGGFLPSGTFTLKFLRSDFNDGAGPFPDQNDRVTYDGEVYKVTSYINKADSPFIKVSIDP